MSDSPEKSKPIDDLIREMLVRLGEDPSREGLVKTPLRVDQSLHYLTSGYREDPYEILKKAQFREEFDEMIVVQDIDLFSLCEHHLLPFFGKAHVGYIPKGKIVGLSKIPRLVNAFSRRLQVQERLTQQIANCINEVLEPDGVGVVIEALHLCMAMRGVEKQNAVAVTSSMLGSFRKDRRTRSEFLSLIRRPSRVGMSR
jgi:GTP cyclohydrolase I